MPDRPAGVGQVADDVPVRVEQAHRRDIDLSAAELAATLSQQVGRLKHRRLVVALDPQQRAGVCTHVLGGFQVDGPAGDSLPPRQPRPVPTA